MQISLPCSLSLLRDEDVSVVMLAIDVANAPLFLVYLDGLKMGRIGKLSLEDQKGSVSFVFRKQLEMIVSFPDQSMRSRISSDVEELLRCCCVDGVLGNYERPHVDIGLGIFEFTFAVS